MIVQSHESDVLSYSECKIAKSFWGFCPGLHWEGLTASPPPPPPPRLPSSATVFLFATLVEKPALPKNCWIRHCMV